MNQLTNKLLAQVPVPVNLGTIGGGGLGPFANLGTTDPTGLSAFNSFARVISFIIGIITIIAGLYFMFQLLLGGFGWMTASGDKTRLQSAQDRLSHSIIGLVIVVAAYAIVSLLARLLGFQSFLLGDPRNLIKQLRLQ